MALPDLKLFREKLEAGFNESLFMQERSLPMEFKNLIGSINSNEIIYFNTTAVIKCGSGLKIYMANHWFYIAAYFSELYLALSEYRNKVFKILRFETNKLAETPLKNAINNKDYAVELFNKVNYKGEDKELLIRFISDYKWWGGGKSLDRNDFFYSPILNSAKLVNQSQAYCAEITKFLAENQNARDVLLKTIDTFGTSKDTLIVNVLNVPEKNLLNTDSLQQIFFGAPGTGKSNAIKRHTANQITFRTTFHPDTDYASFVGAYKPVMKEVDMKVVPVVLNNGASFNQNEGSFKEKRISYEFVMQPFLQAYVAAWKEQANEHPKPVYLIIEEINRGNCAQIFGDIFQLLDRDEEGFSEYPIRADEDLKGQLALQFAELDIENEAVKAGEVLLLPNNLYIWATMNTSDQSLFPIDSAFKRRWDWKYMPITNERKGWKIVLDHKSYDWWTFLDIINNIIADCTRSEDKKLGYFFCKAKQNGIIDADTFVGKMIFYLWNDVFKDYGFEGEWFKDTDGALLSFDKFYKADAKEGTAVNTDKVALFLHNLNVPLLDDSSVIESEEADELEDNNEEPQDEDSSFDESESSDTSDRSKYSVNGVGHYGKCRAPYEAIKEYCKNNPDMTAKEVADTWLALGVNIPNLIETEEVYRERVRGSVDSKLKTKSILLRLTDGSLLYVSNQYNPTRIADFVKRVNAHNLGIHIEKVSE
jgi:hypothetical protein